MADTLQIVTGATPEAVAYALFIGIAVKEDKIVYAGSFPVAKADATWVLDTYKKCLQAVRENGAAKEEIHADRGGSGKKRKTEARAG